MPAWHWWWRARNGSSIPRGAAQVRSPPWSGYTQEQLHKILGGHLPRVFREAERVSAEPRAAKSAGR